MKFHYLSWRTSNSSFLLQFLGKQSNVRVCPRKIKRIDRIVATVQRRRSNGASFSWVSSRYFRRVESIYCFHRHPVLPGVHHGQVSKAIVNSCRSGCHFSPATFSQARAKPRSFRAIIFLENPTLSGRGRPQTAHRRSRSNSDSVAGIAVEIPLFIVVDGALQLGLADSRVCSCIKRQIDSRTDDRSSILSKALINPGHSGGLLRVFSTACLICLLLVFPVFFRLSRAKC